MAEEKEDKKILEEKKESKENYRETLTCKKCGSKNIYTNVKDSSKVCRKCGYREIPTKDKEKLVEGL